ncbi:MAG: hypothetical protein A4E70_02279 [Syntrophus sp. PtaU1.Bin005]|nr:MAG: hypothetical protein A4E70_02279 [Syntrophus sp. PtaU1.Bin005]
MPVFYEIGPFPGRPLFIILKIGQRAEIIIVVLRNFLFLQLQLGLQEFSVLAGIVLARQLVIQPLLDGFRSEVFLIFFLLLCHAATYFLSE